MSDMTYVLVILLVVLVGFGNAFFVLTKYDGLGDGVGYDRLEGVVANNSEFGTLWTSFASLFAAMLGGSDLTIFDDVPDAWFRFLCRILYIVYIVLQAIIMLNLLIALMGDSHSNIVQRALGQWRCEQAKIILEMEQVLAAFTSGQWREKGDLEPTWLHVLREQGADGEERDELWRGQINAIAMMMRNILNDRMKGTDGRVQSLHEEVGAKVSVLQSKVDGLDAKMVALQSSMAEILAKIGGGRLSPPMDGGGQCQEDQKIERNGGEKEEG